METMMFVLVVAAVAITTSVYGGDSMGGDSCKGCIDRNGTCRSAGEKWEDQCSTFKCKKSKTEDGKKGWKSVVTRFGCKDRNGTCHKMRQKWKDQCSTFKCKKTKAGDGTFELKAIRVRYGCMDADNKCHRLREKGWPYVLNGTRYENCFCKKQKNEDKSFTIKYMCK